MDIVNIMEYKGKVSLIGNERTGKTSLILRYINDTFTEEYITTLGADFVEKTYMQEDLSLLDPEDEITLVFWDMAGQSHFLPIATIYCEGSSGFIIVFDVNERKTFDGLPDWVKFANDTCPGSEILIVGNKTDLEWAISEEDVKKMEKKLKIPIVFASAKRELDDEGSNVINLFNIMAENLFKIFQNSNNIENDVD